MKNSIFNVKKRFEDIYEEFALCPGCGKEFFVSDLNEGICSKCLRKLEDD